MTESGDAKTETNVSNDLVVWSHPNTNLAVVFSAARGIAVYASQDVVAALRDQGDVVAALTDSVLRS